MCGNQINGAIDTFYIPPSNDTGIFQYHCVVQQLPEEIDCWVSTDTCTLIVTDGPSVETPDQDTIICVDGTIDHSNCKYRTKWRTTKLSVVRQWNNHYY